MWWERRGRRRDGEWYVGRGIIAGNEWGEGMSMLCNSTIDHQMAGMDARTRVASRAVPSSLRPNLFSGD